MQWQDIIDMARNLAATPTSDPLHQIHLHTAVRSAYLAAYHALARGNADLLVGASDAERIRPEWLRAYRLWAATIRTSGCRATTPATPKPSGCSPTLSSPCITIDCWLMRIPRHPSPPPRPRPGSNGPLTPSMPSYRTIPCSAGPSPLRYCSDRRERRNLRTNMHHRPGLQRRQSVRYESSERWNIIS